MRIAREGWPFIGAFWLMELGFVLFGYSTAAIVWLPVAIWVIAFFRDPIRNGPRGEGLVIAPADGLVVSVRDIDEPDFHGGEVQRVSIFMNVFNVHVNRYPVDGSITYRKYSPGAFVNAAAEKASLENEQSSVGIASRPRQGAGAADRRAGGPPHRHRSRRRDHREAGRTHGADPVRVAGRCLPAEGRRHQGG